MAENLKEAKVEVTLVEMSNQVMAPLDFSMASIVHQHLVSKGVTLILNDGVSAFHPSEKSVNISLQSGKQLESDFVVLSIGVRPDTALAKKAGLTIGKLGGISVNNYLQSSDEDIYAIGDVNGKAMLAHTAMHARTSWRDGLVAWLWRHQEHGSCRGVGLWARLRGLSR